MFTGIVEQVGAVADVQETSDGRRLLLEGGGLGDTVIGASIAVNGVCLTAVEVHGTTVAVDVIPETLSRTNLGEMSPGGSVNLERPMPADGRFDGHIVQGHVDGVGSISHIDRGLDGTVMTIRPTADLMPFIVEKGSITVDGVSLTVSGIGDDYFSVALIPHTLEVTTLGLRNAGDTVNLETDVLAKYVERLLEFRK
jgi:riboflavin synthase